MQKTETSIRTRRSDYVIRKQADFGPRRWSIHYRSRHYSDPYILAYSDTRQQAREIVAILINAEEKRWNDLREKMNSGFYWDRIAETQAQLQEAITKIKERQTA